MIKKLLLAALIIAALVFATYVFHTKADVAVFYPKSCLGGWQNPQSAEGKPEVDSSNTFNYKNSASIADSVADIFCGSFSGEIPKDTMPKKFYLKLSWSLGQVAALQSKPDMTASAIDALDEAASSSDSISSSMDASSTVTATLEDAPTPTPSIDSDTNDSDTDSGADSDAAPAPVPESVPESTPIAPDAPQSFLWRMIFSTAYADEESSTTDMLAAVAADDEQAASSTDSSSVTVSTASTTEASSTDEAVNSPLLVVSYTLDGVSWKELVTVGSSNTQNTFEIPQADVSSWNDISNLQIKISRIATLGNEPEVFVDAMSLNVEYGKDPTTDESRSDKKRFDISEIQSSSNNMLLLSAKTDSDQGNVLVVRSYDGGEIYFFNIDDGKLIMTDGVSTDPVEFPAYQFDIGHYAVLFAADGKDCSGKNFNECIQMLNSFEKGTFSIAAGVNTPAEFLPYESKQDELIATTTSSE